MGAQVAGGVERVQCREHARRLADVIRAHDRQHAEPADHDHAESIAEPPAAEPLDGEQRHQDDERDRYDIGLEHGGRDRQALDRRQDGDSGRDHAVAVEQRRARDPDHQQRLARPRAHDLLQRQREQRHDAALALVVGAHDKEHVLERYDDDE